MAGASETTTKSGSLQLTDSGLIGTCFGVAALGLVLLTAPSGGGNAGSAPAEESESSATIVDAPEAVSETDAEFGARVRNYLMQNPEVIFEAVAVYEQRNASAQADMDRAILEANAEDLFNDNHSWVGGNPEGDITLVEFLDYRCGFCKRAHEEVATLLEADGNIRLIIKEFPILGPDSELASRFAVATLRLAGDDVYADIHDALMGQDGPITPEYLDELAAAYDLDFEALVAEMDSDDVTSILAENRALAQRLQISGTPTFVMETEMIRGFVDADVLIETAQALRD